MNGPSLIFAEKPVTDVTPRWINDGRIINTISLPISSMEVLDACSLLRMQWSLLDAGMYGNVGRNVTTTETQP